jgi:hypothetical protein
MSQASRSTGAPEFIMRPSGTPGPPRCRSAATGVGIPNKDGEFCSKSTQKYDNYTYIYIYICICSVYIIMGLLLGICLINLVNSLNLEN